MAPHPQHQPSNTHPPHGRTPLEQWSPHYDTSHRTSTRQSRLRPVAWVSIGTVALIAVWAGIAHKQLDYILPGPQATWDALIGLFHDPDFYTAVTYTLGRSIGGLAIAIVAGIAWGTVAGIIQPFAWLTTTFQQMLLSTPPIIFVILGLTWLGSNGWVAVMVVALVCTPIVSEATREAIAGRDKDLTDMAHVFALPQGTVITRIIVPMVAPPVLAAVTVALGLSIRVGVMAELLATTTGVGGAIRMEQININTPGIFAYAVVMIVITFVLDKAIVAPLKMRLSRHR